MITEKQGTVKPLRVKEIIDEDDYDEEGNITATGYKIIWE